MLLTNWETEQALEEFVGTDWNKAVIPVGMEKFVAECWVDYFRTEEQPALMPSTIRRRQIVEDFSRFYPDCHSSSFTA